MSALAQLESIGYEFRLEDEGTIHYAYKGVEPPDDASVRPLLAKIRENRQEVVAVLSARLSLPAKDEGFTNRTKCRVVFPANTSLPFPAGSWRRLDDGRIEAMLSYVDLEQMRMWRDEILS